MKLSGHGVFIVTCAGGTQGFASWEEVVAAGKSSHFLDESTFELLQSQERRLWCRTEWSGFTGGAGDLVERHTSGVNNLGSVAAALAATTVAFMRYITRVWLRKCLLLISPTTKNSCLGQQQRVTHGKCNPCPHHVKHHWHN